MIGSSAKSSNLAEFQIVISEQLISFKHCISSRLLLNSLVLFDIKHATSSFPSLLTGPKEAFCFDLLL